MRMNILALVFGLAITFHAGACSNTSLKKQLEQFTTKNSIGFSALVATNGKVLCEAAVGNASIELSVPMNNQHLFEIGSLTKQFTAVVVLLLAQENKLSLDDDISFYVPEINTTKGKVTIRHLLAHTSGLVDPINEPEFLATRVQENTSLAQLINLFKNNNWQYPAGDRVQYSNVGYSMLAYVIEKVTGQSYSEFLSARIFKPLGMTHTYQASFAVIHNKVTGYTFADTAPRQHDFLNLNWAYGAADIVSNTKDLYRFTQALMHKQLLNSHYLDLFLSRITLNDKSQTDGTFNYSLSTIGDTAAITMSGSTMGYSSHSIFLPEQDSYIVVLSNSDGINGGSWIPPATVAGKLAASLLSFPLPDYSPVDLTAINAQQYLGKYHLEEQVVRTLDYVNGAFVYQRNDGPKYEVIPMKDHGFYFKDTLSYFYIKHIGTEQQQMDFYTFLSNQPQVAKLKKLKVK